MIKRILIVDDEPDIVAILRVPLEAGGYEVAVAGDAAAAEAWLTRWVPDLIILDVMLPKLNGWEFCRKLKGDPSFSRVPVLILTAKAQPLEVLRGWEAGADEHITKPFRMSDLLAKVEKLLKGSESPKTRPSPPVIAEKRIA
ncbi:MAG: response regulator transcription factor [Armatimonadetes bacterium]|nr:response regulator transcription factor [Armatimonadota bacterium]